MIRTLPTTQRPPGPNPAGAPRRTPPRATLGTDVLPLAAAGRHAVRGAPAHREAIALRDVAARPEAPLERAASDAAGAASPLNGVSGDAGALAGHAQNPAALTDDPVSRPAAGEFRLTAPADARPRALARARPGHPVAVAVWEGA